MSDVLLQIAFETWEILKEASTFLLFGFALAGVLAVLVPSRIMTRLVGTGKIKSVLWGSALGIPVPLCSCGVLPTALGLWRQGATPGATAAFLIATPETGIDSISLTYALTDPVLTIARPLAGVLAAVAAGLATNFLGVPLMHADEARGYDGPDRQAQRWCAAVSDFTDVAEHGHSSGHGRSNTPTHDHDHFSPEERVLLGRLMTMTGLRDASVRVYRYAFHELLDDISYWLVLGMVLSGIVAAVLPADLIEQHLSGGLISMLAMLLISIPLYTCASSSTPLAAALVLKGLSPGAALVFLLAGPATNLSSLVVLLKALGTRVVAVYLSVVVGMALLAGWALDFAYSALAIHPRASFGTAGVFVPEPLKVVSAIALIALLAASMRRAHIPAEWVSLHDRIARLTGLSISAAQLWLAAIFVAAAVYLSSGLFQVAPGETAMKLRFGRIVAPTLDPGLHFRLPWPIESEQIIPLAKVRRMTFGFARPQLSREELTRALTGNRGVFGASSVPDSVRASGLMFQKEAASEDSFLLTGDSNLIDLRSTVQYCVKDALAYAFAIVDPDALMRSATLAAIRSVIATHSIDAIYTTARDEVEREVAHAVQSKLDKYGAGIEVVSFRLFYVHPPDVVHDAFRDVASAQEDKLRTVNRANIFAVEKVNESKGQAAAMVEQALAARDQDIKHAEGDAAAFTLQLDAYRKSPELTRFRLQLETIGAVLPGVRKIVRPGAGEVKDFDLWLLRPFAAGEGK